MINLIKNFILNYKIIFTLILFLVIFIYIWKLKNENTEYLLTISSNQLHISELENKNKQLIDENNLLKIDIDNKSKSINILNLEISEIKKINDNTVNNYDQLYTDLLNKYEKCQLDIQNNNLNQITRDYKLDEALIKLRNNIYNKY